MLLVSLQFVERKPLGLREDIAELEDHFIGAVHGCSPALPQIQFFKEIIAFVVDHDEGGEIFHLDPPDRFHAELGIFLHLDLLDAVLGKIRRAPPIEAR